ncbi:MAG TPA: SpoIIE family protein phosphatase [Acidimicrobiales bacterium]|nr:SpoIIE family protein phosphatase [Acidimicrobiales bacterium]
MDRRTRCRTLIGGFGVPGLRDLDIGRSFVSYSEHLDWPDDVVVEEVPSSALMVLHRLQELRPAKLVVVVAASRGPDQPGTIRRYHLVDPPAVDLHDHGPDSLVGGLDLHHSLALARQWGALPDTVVIEVEPAETTLGLGFSEDVGASLDRIVALIREELGGGGQPEGGRAQLAAISGDGDGRQGAWQLLQTEGPQDPVHDVVHDLGCPPDRGPILLQRGSSVRFGQLPDVDGLVLSARIHPGDPERRMGGDWCDVVPLADGWTEVLIGEVLGHGLNAVAMMSQLRTAARASSLSDGQHPSHVLAHLDRVVEVAGVGEMVAAVCLAVHAPSGEVRIANAGHCPPLLCVPDRPATLCEQGQAAPLGSSTGNARTEASFSFPLDSVLLLVTYGLVDAPDLSTSHRMAELLVVADSAPGDTEGLCDHVLMAAQAGLPPGEGGSVLAIRRAA